MTLKFIQTITTIKTPETFAVCENGAGFPLVISHEDLISGKNYREQHGMDIVGHLEAIQAIENG